MSKRSTVQPRWLDAMLVQWGIRHLRQESNALGFPRICVMLKDGIPLTSPVYDDWELTPQDFRDLQTHIERLERKHQLVICRAYRPWQAAEIEIELGLFDVSTRTWTNWLHDAAAQIVAGMARKAA